MKNDLKAVSRSDGDGRIMPEDAACKPGGNRQVVSRARAERKSMAKQAGFAVLAEGLEGSVAPRDEIEAMLLDQLAQTHNAAVRLLGNASVADTPELMIKFSNASARLMDVFAQGALTLHKLRTGGAQVVTVQHIAVSGGGQAVVAGQITPGASRSGSEREPR